MFDYKNMKKIIKLIYWIIMSLMFILLFVREKKLSELNVINIDE